MDHEEMMLECLRLATEQGLKGDDARTEAKSMFNQITGRGQGGLRTEELTEEKAREWLRRYSPNDIVGGGKARVVGKDGDIPFKDYKREE